MTNKRKLNRFKKFQKNKEPLKKNEEIRKLFLRLTNVWLLSNRTKYKEYNGTRFTCRKE